MNAMEQREATLGINELSRWTAAKHRFFPGGVWDMQDVSYIQQMRIRRTREVQEVHNLFA